MRISDFDDNLIDDVRSGSRALTREQREFLISDTPSFEECCYSPTELSAMSDPDLMSAAYGVWADYASGQV